MLTEHRASSRGGGQGRGAGEGRRGKGERGGRGGGREGEGGREAGEGRRGRGRKRWWRATAGCGVGASAAKWDSVWRSLLAWGGWSGEQREGRYANSAARKNEQKEKCAGIRFKIC